MITWKKILAVLLVLFAVLIFLSVFIFGTKKYTFFSPDIAVEEFSYIKFYIQDSDEKDTDIHYQEYLISNRDVLNEIKTWLDNTKFKPIIISADGSRENCGTWNMELHTEDDIYLNLYNCGQLNDKDCLLNIGEFQNGVGYETKWNILSACTISSQKAEELYQILKKVIEEDIPDITLEEIGKFAENNNTNWEDYQKFHYSLAEEEDKSLIPPAKAAKFEIQDNEGELIVWYNYSNIIENDKAIMLREVTDAKIVGADGEETDIFQGDLNIRRDE